MTLALAPFIPHSRPLLGPEEEEAAVRVLRSGRLASGPEVEALEEEMAREIGVRHAVALGHGTAALHLGLLALGAEPGTTVLLPSYTCVSLLNAVVSTGARPVLVDCRPGTPDMDLEAAREHLTQATAAALVPHPFGRPLDLRGLDLQVPVLGDATHALGATLRGRPVARQGRAAAFSFYATKLLAAGEGGLLASRHGAPARHARDLRSYDERNRWRLRFNYKMSEMAAAVLRVQLRRLPGFLDRRRQLADFYRRELDPIVDLPEPFPGEVPYRFTFRLPTPAPVLRALRQRGIGAARPVFRPLHRFLGLPARLFPHAEAAWRHTVSLPLYPALEDAEAERVVRAVREVLR